MLVRSSPKTPELEDEYNSWYTDVHIPEVLETPGFRAVTRYKLFDDQSGQGAKYLAIWEIEADDIPAAAKALQEQAVKDGWQLDDAIDPSSMAIQYFEPISDRITEK